MKGGFHGNDQLRLDDDCGSLGIGHDRFIIWNSINIF